MRKYVLICVPRSLPDLSYGGPTISSEALKNILVLSLNAYCRILSFPDSSFTKSAPSGTRKGNIFYQLVYIISFFIRFYRKEKIMLLNSFFHPQSIAIYLFINVIDLFSSSHKFLLLISPRAELMDRGQPSEALKQRIKRLVFRLFLAFENLNNYRSKLAFTSRDEFNYTSKYFKSYLVSRNVRHIILPNIPNDLLAHRSYHDDHHSTYLNRFDQFKQTRTLSLCYLGRLSPEKGICELIKTLASFADAYTKVNLSLYGAPSAGHLQFINHTIENYPNSNLSVCIEGLVSREKLVSCLNSHLVAIFPSKGENYCHSLAECLSIGLPVIYSGIPFWSKYLTTIRYDDFGPDKLPLYPIYDYADDTTNLITYMRSLSNVQSPSYVELCCDARSIFENEYNNSSENLVKQFNTLTP